MFTIVDLNGQQHKVKPSERLYVPKLAKNVGDSVSFDRILLVADDKSVRVGNPLVKGISVQAKVLAHVKDETVIVFKKKRRKGYRLRKGHRQQYTQVEITSIG